MSALYRRFRPLTFQEVVGQEHVKEPLLKAIREGRLAQAYLFSGPRGVGKTTTARLLAMAVGCQGEDPLAGSAPTARRCRGAPTRTWWRLTPPATTPWRTCGS